MTKLPFFKKKAQAETQPKKKTIQPVKLTIYLLRDYTRNWLII